MCDNHEKDLWNALEKLAFWASIAAMVILAALYFVVGWAKPDQESMWGIARVFVLDITANLIPVLLLFMASYALFRRIQALRSDQETEALASKISSKVADMLKSQARIPREKPAPGKLIIDSAIYGAKAKTRDVAQLVSSRISQESLEIRVCNENLGGDPNPGEVKALEVVYFYDGIKHSIRIPEGRMLTLP